MSDSSIIITINGDNPKHIKVPTARVEQFLDDYASAVTVAAAHHEGGEDPDFDSIMRELRPLGYETVTFGPHIDRNWFDPNQWRDVEGGNQVYVSVEPVVDLAELSNEDADVPGIYLVKVGRDVPIDHLANAALDVFHENIAVGALDNFSFKVFSANGEIDEADDVETYIYSNSGSVDGPVSADSDLVASLLAEEQ